MKPEPESLDDCDEFYARDNEDRADALCLSMCRDFIGIDLASGPDVSVEWIYDTVKKEFTYL